jgi:protein PhnA
MALSELMTRSGGTCEFCGVADGLAPADVAPEADAILLCDTCREADGPAAGNHWRCLEGAAWSDIAAVQVATWRKLGQIDAAWATETRAAMTLSPEALAWAEATAAGDIIHRDSNGTVLARGDTVVLIKDLTVKGANFTAKRGTAVRGISLVSDNAAQIEGRVEGQRIVILTEFVKKK